MLNSLFGCFSIDQFPPSPTSDQNLKMTDDEEDRRGEIYGRLERRKEGEVRNCETL